MFVPKSVKKTKDFGAFSASEDDGDALKRLTEDVARMRDESIKQNRDNMDALYNIDMDNVSPSLRDLFKSWTNGISSADARITAIADSQKATIQLVTQFTTSVSDALIRIEGKADANSASITQLTNFKTETSEAISKIEQTASANSASITQLAQVQTETGTAISQIQQNVGANSSSITQLSKVQTETSESIAKIQQSVGANSANINQLLQFKTDTNSALSSINQSVSANSASITQIVQHQGETDTAIAQITQTASGNTASIEQLVGIVGANGEVITASVKTAIENDESFISMVADKVVIKGDVTFVKKDDLGDNGSTEVSGNRVALIMDGGFDDGYAIIESRSNLLYDYLDNNGNRRLFGKIYTMADGTESETTSRYAMVISTHTFRRSYDMRYVNPSIKLVSAGRMSMESQGSIYMQSMYGSFVMESEYGVRVRARLSYAESINVYPSTWNDYVFATDGIYYNGTKIVST
jgi:hypothetical protein